MPWIHEGKKSTVMLLCRTRLVEYYLERGFIILQHNSKNLIIVHNEAKKLIHEINIRHT